MSFLKSKAFKYLKNLIIGVGAALVMIGALYKLQSWEMPVFGGIKFDFLTIGLLVEAFIFLFLGLIGPEKDYYWEKLYPGLDQHGANLSPLSAGPSNNIANNVTPLNGEVVEGQLGGMLDELRGMSKSLGSLKALQEVDFSQTAENVKAMSNFSERLNTAMMDLSASVEDTKVYKAQMESLNKNLTSLNGVYDGVYNFYGKLNESMSELEQTVEGTKVYKDQLASLNKNLSSLNGVYGNVLSAFQKS